MNTCTQLETHDSEEMAMGYELTGRMAEVCSCKSLCPCSVGEDPDSG